MNTTNRHFETLSIHAGGEDRNPKNALNHPIFMTSSFEFDSLEHADATFGFETDDYVYTRGNNPTLKLLEERMAALERGAASVAFASGMAAISSVLMSLLKPGDEIIIRLEQRYRGGVSKWAIRTRPCLAGLTSPIRIHVPPNDRKAPQSVLCTYDQ